jgi:hypothetical protein
LAGFKVTLWKQIARLPPNLRRQAWAKALDKANKKVNNMRDFRNPQQYAANLHILKQKCNDVDPEYLVF